MTSSSTDPSPYPLWTFVHIPKTGGSSVRTALREEVASYEFGRKASGHQPIVDYMHSHDRVSHYVKRMHVSRWRERFSFATFRNPFDRLVSVFFHTMRPAVSEGKLPPDGDWVEPFREWCLTGQASFYPVGGDRQWLKSRMSLKSFLRQPQVTWLDGPGVDFLVRTEHLEDDFAEACRRAGIGPYEVGRVNCSEVREGQPGYREFYDDACRAFVENKYWADLSLGGYEF